MKEALTTGDIAKLCGVHFRTVIRWIERGQLKAYQLPGRGDNRIQKKDFISFLEENNMPIPDVLSEHEQTQAQDTPRVLVVDDDKAMAAAVQRVLRQKKYEIQVANGGFEAGACLATHKPDLITLDLDMPDLGGIDILKFIREDESLAKIKILVISALADFKLQAALQAGADAILAKPFDNQQLLDKVAWLLDEEEH